MMTGPVLRTFQANARQLEDSALQSTRVRITQGSTNNRQLVERTEVCLGENIPPACRDWASSKAACRFFSPGAYGHSHALGGARFGFGPLDRLSEFRKNAEEPRGEVTVPRAGNEKIPCYA